MKRWVVSAIAVVAVLFLAAFGRRVSERLELGAQAQEEAMSILSGVEGYSAKQKWFEARVKLAHWAAMDSAYKLGGPREATLDSKVYLSKFLEALMKQACDEGRQDIVQSLIRLRDERGITHAPAVRRAAPGKRGCQDEFS